MMSFEDARRVLIDAVTRDDGVFTRLRMGQNCSRDDIHQLCVCLRTLWRTLRNQDAVPSDIASAAGFILHFRREVESNATSESRNDQLELEELFQGAFGVLAGLDAQFVRRDDLGDTAENFA